MLYIVYFLATFQFCLVMMAVVMCNIRTPAMRKERVVKELSSITMGLLVFLLFFCITWTFAFVAYMKFPGQELPDFYPAFQVMNSFTGIIFFICIGLGSLRFRGVMTGKLKNEPDSMKSVLVQDIEYDEQEEDEELEDEDDEASIGTIRTSPTRSSRPSTNKSTRTVVEPMNDNSGSDEDAKEDDGSDDDSPEDGGRRSITPDV